MHLEVVVHVYNPPGIDQYAKQMLWLHRSLLFYSERKNRLFRDVELYVCMTTTDEATSDVMQGLLGIETTPGYRIVAECLPPEQLFRRAIGRNIRSKATSADIVWYTDADYFVGPDFLDEMCGEMTPDSEMWYPSRMMINKSHEIGDEMIRDYTPGDIHPELFAPQKLRKGIGGVQFVGGNFARETGYCEGTKWVRPVDPKYGFRQCKCDVAYRRRIGGGTRVAVESSLYRIRHTSDGRDYDLDGQKGEGKANW